MQDDIPTCLKQFATFQYEIGELSPQKYNYRNMVEFYV